MAHEMDRLRRVLKALALAVALVAAPAAAEDACRIAILGDSIASGYGLSPGDALPVELERRLREDGYGCEVVDAGVAGDTTAGGLARLDWMLADEPSHVIVELGGNDGLRALPPEQMEANLDAIVERLQAEGVSVLLTGMLAPPNLGREYGAAFAAVFPRVAERHGVPLYPFLLEGVAAVPELNQGDGIHPTPEGVDEIARRMLPTLEAWLDASSA